MRKRIRLAALSLVFVVLLNGCSENGGSSNNGVVVTSSLNNKPAIVGNIPCPFPLTDKTISLNILTSVQDGILPDDVFVWEKYKEMTNVNVSWITTSKSEREQAVLSALSNKIELDLILRCRIPANSLTQYGENGLILDLAKDDLLEKYAPNCWAYLKSHPDALASVMNPDGTIYSLPQINSGAELRVSRKLFINKKWLDNLGLEIPTTTEELYNVLKAFKEQDANANGDPNDEIPLCTQDWRAIQEAFFGAFGLGNRGVHNQIVDYDEEKGDVRFIAASDSYRGYLEYLNRLFSEGLLDNYIFTMTSEQWKSNAAKDLIGAFSYTNLASVPSENVDNWVAIETALEGPNGDKLWTAIRANFHSEGAAVIPSTCKKPALVLRWLDYFWTDEGTLFYHMGIEGETFVVNEDGSYDYTPSIYDEMKGGKSFDEVVAAYSPYPGGGNPTVEIAPYFMGGEMAETPAAAARKLIEFGPKEYWPLFTFSAEENQALDTIKLDIDKYVSSMCIEFITGSTPLAKWDEYKAQLEKLGCNELLDIYRAAVERYEKLFKTQ